MLLWSPCSEYSIDLGAALGTLLFMPRQAKFRPVRTPGKGWRLNVPACLAVSGHRERYFFRSKELALAEAGKLRERLETFGTQSSAISPSLAEQATAAASLLVPLGKPLETLIFEHGHTGGVEMLRRHYIGAMPKAEALIIWAIGPHGKKIPNLAIA